jgi:hypothetical protein
LPQQQQTVQRTEARLHKVRKELREILGLLSGPEPQARIQIKERPVPTAAAKPGLFEL